jgi:hypothetical protein
MDRIFRFSSALLSLVSLGLIAGACSSSSGGAGTSSGFVNEYCGLVAPCCAKAGRPADGATCRSFYGALTSSATYDAAKGDACLAALRAASSRADYCDHGAPDADACDDVYRLGGGSGTKKPGEACSEDGDCATSPLGKVDCATSYGTGGAKTSVCQLQLPGKEGDTPCGGTIDGNTTSFSSSSSGAAPPSQVFMCNVKDGIYCKYSYSTTGAAPPTCTRIQDIGGACDSSSSSSYACVKTAYCDFTTKTCKAKLAIGEPCSGSSTCAPGGYCDTTVGSTSTCKAQLPEGSACTSSSQCVTNNCNNKKCEKSSDFGLSLICGN